MINQILLSDEEIIVLISIHEVGAGDYCLGLEGARLAVIPVRSILGAHSELECAVDQEFKISAIDTVAVSSCVLDVPRDLLGIRAIFGLTLHGAEWIYSQSKYPEEGIVESISVTHRSDRHLVAFMVYLQKRGASYILTVAKASPLLGLPLAHPEYLSVSPVSRSGRFIYWTEPLAGNVRQPWKAMSLQNMWNLSCSEALEGMSERDHETNDSRLHISICKPQYLDYISGALLRTDSQKSEILYF